MLSATVKKNSLEVRQKLVNVNDQLYTRNMYIYMCIKYYVYIIFTLIIVQKLFERIYNRRKCTTVVLHN